MEDEWEENLFLDIYDLAFDANGPEIFNDIAEKITIFLKASSCSLWINNFKVAETETRLGYYSNENDQKLTQLDYDVSYKTMKSKEPVIDKIIDGEKKEWFYVSCPFDKKDLTGCYTIWFGNWIENDFKEKSKKVITLRKLAKVIASVASHFLACSRFDCKRIIRELSVAERIQSSLIPTQKPKTPNVSVGIRSLMANGVGGDYLDLIPLDNEKLGIAVGDAMGKGIPGAFIMLTTRAVFRLLTKANVEPEVLLRQLNICLTPELIQQNMFVSFFYGVYNSQNRNFKYSIAGHNPPVIFRRGNRKLETLDGRGLIIGGKYQTTFQSFDITLEKGDILLLYTDGVKDIKNKENKPFGIEGIKKVLLNYAEYDADGISNCLAQVLMKYCGNRLNDDASFIVLKAE